MSFEFTTVGEFATVQGGYAFKSQDFISDSGIPVLKIKNIRNGFVDYGDTSFISAEIADGANKWSTKDGDILVSMTGSGPNAPDSLVGRIAKVWRGDPPAFINQRVGRIVLKEPNRIDPDFIYYVLSQKVTQEFLVLNSTGSANQVNINSKTIESVPCPDIDYETSKSIAKVLRSLDKRIRLLGETNATLESIAQALFKSWFVDFDPVHANAGTQAPSLPPEIQSLFPSTFVESPLGLVPEGWGVDAVYNLANYINGAAYKAFEPNSDRRGFPIIKIAELKAGVTTQTAYSDVEMNEKYRIDNKEVLFSWSGNPDTSIDTFVWLHGKAWLNQHIFKVVPHEPHDRSFVLLMLKYLNPVFSEIARDKQTTGLGHVTVADLKRLQIAKPDNEILFAWNEIVDPIIERSYLVMQKANTLSQLRDTLLPRLISGQLRLPEAENLIEESA
jgi:type I restriction enzyme S subunit